MNVYHFINARELLASVGVAILFFALLIFNKSFFLDPNNLISIQIYFGPLCLLAIAMMTLFIVGMFDLSIGATMAAASMLTVAALSAGFDAPLAVSFGIATGAIVGFLNGMLVVFAGFNPLITTLGTMYVIRGLVDTASGGGLPKSWMYINTGSVDLSLFDLGNIQIFGLFIIIIFSIIFALITSFVLQKSVFGRNLYLIGSNISGARGIGIKADRVRLILFVVMGVTAAITGILITARTGQATRFLGIGVEMQVIIACLVGGATIGGGRGTVLGAITGASFMTLINNGFNAWEIRSEWQKFILGFLLVSILVFDYFARRMNEKRNEMRSNHVTSE